jgi:hypothetical protein
VIYLEKCCTFIIWKFKNIKNGKVKVKFTLEQTTKAQRGGDA